MLKLQNDKSAKSDFKINLTIEIMNQRFMEFGVFWKNLSTDE